MLTASTEEDAVVEAIAVAATGYLRKHSGPEELVEVIRNVAQADCAYRSGTSGGSSRWYAASGASPPTEPWKG